MRVGARPGRVVSDGLGPAPLQWGEPASPIPALGLCPLILKVKVLPSATGGIIGEAAVAWGL